MITEFNKYTGKFIYTTPKNLIGKTSMIYTCVSCDTVVSSIYKLTFYIK